MIKSRNIVALGATAALAAALTGCSSYQFAGRVIQGDVSYATIVSADDPQLTSAGGMGGVRVRVVTDPDKLNRKEVGSGVSSPDGSFSFDLDAFAAGVLEYDIAVDAAKPGYSGVEEAFRMPRKGERVLIVLAPGSDTRRRRENLMEDYNTFR